MRRKHLTTWLLTCSSFCAAVSCGNAVDAPHVDYGDTQPLGRWPSTAVQARFETQGVAPASSAQQEAEAPEQPTAGKPAVATTTGASTVGAVQPPRTGSAGAAAPSGSTNPATVGTMGMVSMMASAGAAAPSGGQTKPAEMTPAESGAVSSVQFSVTTESLGGRYKPKNIGAIWITDDSGKLVKSLEVWARLRLRYLTKYASARAGAKVDVTATATLTSHKAHMASWDLKDSTGAAVPAGKYTLNAEITDADVTGKNVSVSFDTSAGPMTMKPADSTGFTGMELVLQ